MSGGTEISHGFSGIAFPAILAPFVTSFIANPFARYANALALVYFVIAIFCRALQPGKSSRNSGVPNTALDASVQIRGYVVIAASVVLAALALKPASASPQWSP